MSDTDVSSTAAATDAGSGTSEPAEPSAEAQGAVAEEGAGEESQSNAAAGEESQGAAGAAESEAEAAEEAPAFCIYCGERLTGRPFCTACGKPVE